LREVVEGAAGEHVELQNVRKIGSGAGKPGGLGSSCGYDWVGDELAGVLGEDAAGAGTLFLVVEY
jgi:hypothetical protein